MTGISCVFDKSWFYYRKKSWFMQELPRLKLDWFGGIRLLAIKYSKILL